MYDLMIAQTLEQKYAAICAIDAHLETMTEEQKVHLELSAYDKAVKQYNSYLGDYGDVEETTNKMFGIKIAIMASLTLGGALVATLAIGGKKNEKN